MSWQNQLDRLAEMTARNVMATFSPMLQQSNSALSNTVQGVVSNVAVDGTLTVNTVDGQVLTGIMSSNNSAGPGTTGIILGGSIFRS